MKNIIVTIGEILLGVFIFLLIFVNDNSLKSEVSDLFNRAISNLNSLTP